MTSKPVLEVKSFAKKPVSNHELREAIAYAKNSRPAVRYQRGPKKGRVKRKAYVGQELEEDMLRIIANTALERWTAQPTAKLVMIAAHAARGAIPQYRSPSVYETDCRYQAYKCATMKVMNIRRMWQIERDRERAARGEDIPERPKQVEHALDERPKYKNQFRLFS